MGESYVALPADSVGKKLRTRQRTIGANTIEEQYVIVGDERVASFRGRFTTPITPGRAGTVGQKIAGLFNAAGSAVLVEIGEVRVDLYQTVIKAVTVPPPTVRCHRIAAVPTNGTAGTKVAKDSALTSSASVTTWQDASADRTSSGTALTATIAAGTGLSQEFAPRLITAAGYEPADRMAFLDEEGVTLRAGEGMAVFLDYTVATMNPITDMWIAQIDWVEFTLP